MVVQVHFKKNVHQDFVVQKQFTNYNIKKIEPIKYIPCCMIEFHLGPCIGWHLIASSTIFKDQEKDHYAILKIALDIEMKSAHGCSRFTLLHFICDIGCVVLSFWYFHLENLIVQQMDIKLWTIFLDLWRELQNILND